ncbi:MAG TPA: rhomboid family intramembrane serine protease [Dehalococcoidia bacterium]|nr:rhomboid family intramembrane serine protease [Dehalococcoidia bacterium]
MIPIYDSERSRTFPWVNLTIIALNFAVFLYEIALSHRSAGIGFTQLDTFIYHWGNIPACTLDQFGQHALEAKSRICAQQPHPSWTIITAMFIHGSWLHILGNMVFLWIFGDNVEDSMGHPLYLLFYLLAGAISAFAQMSVSATELTPAIGASGAIAGVMGAYIVLFPRATVAVIIPIFFFIPIPLPALVLIGLWFVAQLFSGFATLGPTTVGAGSGIAYFAHIGGFVAGALLVNVFAIHRKRGPPRRARGPTDAW